MLDNQKPKISLPQFKSALNSIVGFSKLLLDGEVGEISAEQQKQIQHVYQAGYQLMESIQERKAKVVVLWSMDENLLRSHASQIKLEIQHITGSEVYFIENENFALDSVQGLKELNHIKESSAFTILSCSKITNSSAALFEFADDIVIISESPKQENDSQIYFLREFSHFAAKLSFFTSGEALQKARSVVIRKICNCKVGLALSGGMAQGLAHIGVLKVLTKQKVPIDIIAGTSGGALFGSLFAAGMSPEEIENHAARVFRWNIIPNLDILMAKDGFFNNQSLISKMLQQPFGRRDLDFSELTTLFITIACDLLSGKERVIDSGSVSKAVRASMSIPLVFRPLKTGYNFMVDGIVTTPVPVLPLIERGADLIIAVHVSELSPYKKRHPNMFDIFMRARSITSEELSRHQLKDADIVIQPFTKNFSSFNYRQSEAIIKAGEDAAWQAIPEIKQRLGIK